MNNLNILNHVKKVAKNDLRIWAAPFVAVVQATKAELKRPLNSDSIPNSSQKSNHSTDNSLFLSGGYHFQSKKSSTMGREI
jgi:hypothetical protein